MCKVGVCRQVSKPWHPQASLIPSLRHHQSRLSHPSCCQPWFQRLSPFVPRPKKLKTSSELYGRFERWDASWLSLRRWCADLKSRWHSFVSQMVHLMSQWADLELAPRAPLEGTHGQNAHRTDRLGRHSQRYTLGRVCGVGSNSHVLHASASRPGSSSCQHSTSSSIRPEATTCSSAGAAVRG